jgi:hypothetical protein
VRHLICCALLVAPALLAGAIQPAAASAKHCKSFSFTHNGVHWHASKVRVAHLRCSGGRKVIKSYAKPRNCQFESKCRVGKYTCHTTSGHGSDFNERCTHGRRVVRWHGHYVSR